MKNLNVKEKEKLINIMPNFKKETLMYVIRVSPIEFVRKLALNETDDAVIEVILKRLEDAKTQDIVINSYMVLSRAHHFKIRLFVVNEADIKIVCKMAITEVKYEVVEAIVERLNKEKYDESLNKCYCELLKAENDKIKAFAINTLPIEYVKKHITSIENGDILEQINQILN